MHSVGADGTGTTVLQTQDLRALQTAGRKQRGHFGLVFQSLGSFLSRDQLSPHPPRFDTATEDQDAPLVNMAGESRVNAGFNSLSYLFCIGLHFWGPETTHGPDRSIWREVCVGSSCEGGFF